MSAAASRDSPRALNSGCGLLREKFFPVRSLAETALRDLGAEPMDEETLFRRMREKRLSEALKSLK